MRSLRSARALAGFILLAAFAAFAPAGATERDVPAEFIGDWVPADASCASTIRLRVAPRTVTLINGSDAQQFGHLDICFSCEGGARYAGIVVWLLPEFSSKGRGPFRVRFNAGEERGVAIVEFEKADLRQRFPLHKMKLHRCTRAA